MTQFTTAATLHSQPPGHGPIVRMSSTLMRRLGLDPGKPLTLRAGQRRVQLLVAMGEKSLSTDGTDLHAERLYLPSNIVQRMNLPTNWPVMLRQDVGGDVHIGPFVGIFCQRYPRKSIFGPQTAFFRRLIRLGRTMNMCVYVFETRDVDRRAGIVHGVTWLEERGWVRMRFPLPDVLYDRGFVNGPVMHVQRWLRRRGVEQFNSWVGSKLWVYRLMADDPELARYIPETVVLRRTADLAGMIRRHGTVYVKAAGGGKGIGIWVIRGDGQGGYVYGYTDSLCRIRRGKTRDLSSIVQMLLSRPRKPWLIQPRIELLRHKGRIFDVRVLVQRDATGTLQVTGTGARIGRRGSFISNIFGGGDARQLEPLLEETLGLSPAAAAAMREEIERVALSVAELIHRACRRTGHVGELGVDIGIDRRGRLWFFEANSRTGRNVFQMAGMRDSARAAMQRPLEFALYLSGFAGPSSVVSAQSFPHA